MMNSRRCQVGLALAVLVVVAGGLRLAGLDRQPWGLHADQLGPSTQALNALRGRLSFALPDYNIWLHALEFGLLGPSPLAARVLPALAGSLLPLSVFLAVQRLFGRRAALLCAGLVALSLWPLALSRSGFSISYLPIVLSLGLWQLTAAWQTGRAWQWVATGLLLAAAQYVYFPARALLPILGLAAAYALVFGPRQRLWQAWPLLPTLAVAVLPLYWQTSQIQAETTRYETVFILAPENSDGRPWQTLAQQSWLAVSMFFYQGDANYRHNVPPHPIYNLLLAAPALIGLGILLRERWRPRTLFWLTWMGGMLAPMFLSIESPHFFRAAGILPLAFVPPALGLEQLWQRAVQRGRPRLGGLALALVFGLSLGHTTYTYFGPAYRNSRLLYYAFAGQDLDLAVAINGYLGVGWQGKGWLALDTTPDRGRAVWIDRQLLEDVDRRRTVELLVPVGLDDTPAFRSIGNALAQAGAGMTDVRLVLMPGQEQPAVGLLPRHRLIRVQDGPLPSWQPPGVQPIYRLYTTESPAVLPARPIACYADGIELLRVEARLAGEQVAANLYWRAATQPSFDYTVFVHVVAQDVLVGQADRYPVAGRYLTTWWRPGDVVADEYLVEVPKDADLGNGYLRIGLYRWDTVTNLRVSDCAGTALGEFIVVPLTDAR